jgi:hypothetical protein
VAAARAGSLVCGTAWSGGPNYRLYREFEFTDGWNQPRRLFVYEGKDHHHRHCRVVLTDAQYRVLSAVDFDKPGPNFNSNLIQTVRMPILEIVTTNEGKTGCLRFQIVRDHITFCKVGDKVDSLETVAQAS